MKQTFLIILCVFASIIVRAQKPKGDPTDIDKIDTSRFAKLDSLSKVDKLLVTEENVEVEPHFPGGFDAFYQYFAHNIHYPKEAIKNHLQGKVFIRFVIEKNGTVTNVKVVRGISDDIDSEAVRVVESSPKWEPGVQNGRLVRVQYTMPIDFHL